MRTLMMLMMMMRMMMILMTIVMMMLMTIMIMMVVVIISLARAETQIAFDTSGSSSECIVQRVPLPGLVSIGLLVA